MYDDMEPAARREFSGPRRRHTKPAEQPAPTMYGNGLDQPYVPDVTTDRPLSHHDKSDHES